MAPKGNQKAEPEPASKQYKGVYKNKGMWRARVWHVDKEVYLGHFTDEVAAAAAYDRACVCLRGWATAVREGFNLGQSKYRNEASLLESLDIEEFAQESQTGGVQGSSDQKLK